MQIKYEGLLKVRFYRPPNLPDPYSGYNLPESNY